jgi:hypothetical protein
MFIYGLRHDFYFFLSLFNRTPSVFWNFRYSHSVTQFVRLKHECFHHDKVGL